MALRWMLGWITGSSQNGLFPYLTKRNEQRARTDRARSWQAHTVEIANLLRDGTEYEETTPDGSVKIRTPPAQPARISVMVEHQEPELQPREPPAVETRQVKALTQKDAAADASPANDPPTGPDG